MARARDWCGGRRCRSSVYQAAAEASRGRLDARRPSREGPVIEGEFERLDEKATRAASPATDRDRSMRADRGPTVPLAQTRKRAHGRAHRQRKRQRGSPPAGMAGPPVQVRVVGQYIKDLSFENPNVRKLIDGGRREADPARRGERQRHQDGGQSLRERHPVQGRGDSDAGVIYDLELAYAGLFEIQNMPEQALRAVPADQLSVAAVPVPAAPGGRPDAGRRLPAAAARSDRFRRASSCSGSSRATARRRSQSRAVN